MAVTKKNKGPENAPNSMMLRRTLLLMIVCGIVAFLVLVGRLFQLQILEHEDYEQKAIEQQVRDTVITAQRGTIYDTNGKILAMSANVETIFLSPRQIIEDDIKEPGEKGYTGLTQAFIANSLAEILDLDPLWILEKMSKTTSQYEVIARKVEPEVAQAVRDFRSENKITGIHLEEDSKRYYPYSSLASHVIGFVGTDNNGLAGLESVYDEQLSGVNGRVVRAKTARGVDMLFTSFEDYYDASDGNDLRITIDSTIEYYLEKHLLQAEADYDLQNGAGAIAMDVNTGAIKGMVSIGGFDLNNFLDVSEEAQELINAEEDETVRAEMLTEERNKMWRNKTINDTYEPGSTFKIVTLAMALNEGAVSVHDHFYCGGVVDLPGRTTPLNCWKDGGHGSQTLAETLQNSCNIAFVSIGLALGAEAFYDYAEAFGLFETRVSTKEGLSGKTGVDLIGEAGSIWWSEDEFKNPDNKTSLYAASFGQTFNITPLQLITAVSACVNGGYLMQPYLCEEIVDSNGNTVSKTEPKVVRQVISEETSAIVRQMMEQVVSSGTGSNASVAGYRIGGKTGTSTNTVVEAVSDRKEYIVSFIGVAPMDDPQIAILVFLDCPSANSGIYRSGGQMAAPTAGKIFADVLPYLGIEPVYDEQEEQVRDKAVPNIEGLSLDEAIARLTQDGFTFRTIGDGGTVTGQLPAANSIIAAESQVIIYCDASPSEGMATMPDLSNLSYSTARQRLGTSALFIRATGPVTDPSQIVVVSQSIPAGEQLEYGTVIEVSVIDKRNQNEF